MLLSTILFMEYESNPDKKVVTKDVIRDHKTPWNINYYYQSQSIVVLYNTYNWLTMFEDPTELKTASAPLGP